MRGGLLSRGPGRGLGGALGRKGRRRRESRRWRGNNGQVKPQVEVTWPLGRRWWLHFHFLLGGLALLGRWGEEGAIGTV